MCLKYLVIVFSFKPKHISEEENMSLPWPMKGEIGSMMTHHCEMLTSNCILHLEPWSSKLYVP